MAATRHSGLECLRIISIILIVSMHILGNTFHTSNLLNKEFILFVNTLGNTGVTLFILISGYFGIRFNTHKFFKMLVVVWFYSIVSYLIETIWLHTPHTWTGLASSLIPILSKKYWFMTCYVVLYCFSPYLNRLVQNLSQKSYEQLLLLWGFFFIFAPTILFFEIQNDTGKGIINVTLAYLIGQYLKVYGLPKNMKRHSWDILSGSLAGIFILNSLLTAMSGNIILRFARDNNLLIIIASIMFSTSHPMAFFIPHHQLPSRIRFCLIYASRTSYPLFTTLVYPLCKQQSTCSVFYGNTCFYLSDNTCYRMEQTAAIRKNRKQISRCNGKKRSKN